MGAAVRGQGVGDRAVTALRLFVVSASSPDPDTWSIWNPPSIVIAADAEAAVKMVDDRFRREVAEIDMSQARVLLTMPEANWGDDT